MGRLKSGWAAEQNKLRVHQTVQHASTVFAAKARQGKTTPGSSAELLTDALLDARVFIPALVSDVQALQQLPERTVVIYQADARVETAIYRAGEWWSSEGSSLSGSSLWGNADGVITVLQTPRS